MNETLDDKDLTDSSSRPIFCKHRDTWVEWKIKQLEDRCKVLEDQCRTLQNCVDYKAACANCKEYIQRLLKSLLSHVTIIQT